MNEPVRYTVDSVCLGGLTIAGMAGVIDV